MMEVILFKVIIISTIFMFGVISFVQIVHYPLFEKVGFHNFTDYHTHHVKKTGLVVAAPMILDLVASSFIIFYRPENIDSTLLNINLIIIISIWITTFLLQVPCHNQLNVSFKYVPFTRLCSTNWIRTMLWAVKTTLVIWMI